MKKVRRTSPIRAVKIMKLEFFANRFGIDKKELIWGIISSRNEEGEETENLGILFRHDKNLFIDIANDNIRAAVNICGCKTNMCRAKKIRISGGFIFESATKRIKLSDAEIEEIFRNKIYSEALSHAAKRLQ